MSKRGDVSGKPDGQRYAAYIPVSRRHLVEAMVGEGKLGGEGGEAFRQFSEILVAYMHFRFHRDLREIKAAFAPYDPDDETLAAAAEGGGEECGEERMFVLAEELLEKANYRKSTAEDLEEAMARSGVIPLRTEVDFRDFEQFICYYRNRKLVEVVRRKWWLFKEKVKVEKFGRVVVMLQMRGREYFLEKFAGDGERVKALNFEPGKVYAYLYKNIPAHDLELLFPNVKVGMRMVDRLMFGVPAVGGGIAVLLKVVPHVILVAGAVVFFTLGKEAAKDMLSFTEDQARSAWPILTATLALSVALGGLAVRQYMNFVNRKARFQKLVSETLFFRNLATNKSAFASVVDEAEEEEAKEMLLVAYHLTLMGERRPTMEELDDAIEEWIRSRYGVTVDFDIQGPVRNLCGIGGEEEGGEGKALLSLDGEGRCHLVPLREANGILDRVWDGVFRC